MKKKEKVSLTVSNRVNRSGHHSSGQRQSKPGLIRKNLSEMISIDPRPPPRRYGLG